MSTLEFGGGSQVNVPIAVLIWLMIYPMMLKVDFTALGGIARKPKGLMVTLFVNWLVKPFSMALLAWVFMQHLFTAWIDPETAKNYTAGLIILAAAPCTAMVFVWSYLTDGDPVYTLVQVAVNDLIMLVAFAPIVMFLCGVANVVVPSKVLVTSVVVFIVIPLVAGWITRTMLLKSHGKEWFEQTFLPMFHPVTVLALLLTLVLIFAFQAENLTTRWLAVLLLAVPIIIQVYFNSTLAYLLMRWLRVPHNVASPPEPVIASVSLGATRRFRMRPRRRRDLTLDLDLGNGSLLLMAGATQHHWLHAVPKTSRPVGERINLTFRQAALT